jgi:hypothetical protein
MNNFEEQIIVNQELETLIFIGTPVKMVASLDRCFSSSVMTSVGTFKQMWVTSRSVAHIWFRKNSSTEN